MSLRSTDAPERREHRCVRRFERRVNVHVLGEVVRRREQRLRRGVKVARVAEVREAHDAAHSRRQVRVRCVRVARCSESFAALALWPVANTGVWRRCRCHRVAVDQRRRGATAARVACNWRCDGDDAVPRLALLLGRDLAERVVALAPRVLDLGAALVDLVLTWTAPERLGAGVEADKVLGVDSAYARACVC